MRSRSRITYCGASFQGKASVSWRAIHSAVGLVVTLTQMRCLRSSLTIDDEGVEQVEAKCRDNEQVNGGDVRRVVAQEGAPSLTWRSLPLDHVLGHRRLGDLKAELKQLSACSASRHRAKCPPQAARGSPYSWRASIFSPGSISPWPNSPPPSWRVCLRLASRSVIGRRGYEQDRGNATHNVISCRLGLG